MIDLILRAKHWQLFTLTFGVIILTQIVFMISLFSDFSPGEPPDLPKMLDKMMFLPVVIVLSMVVTFGWNWSVGIGLRRFIPEALRRKTLMFRVSLLFPLFYMLLYLSLFILILREALGSMTSPPDLDFDKAQQWFWMIPVVFVMHLFAMFCIFYVMYFLAMTIKTAELQREVSFGDYVGEFFMVWFFPIGVWILQPRINKLMERQPDEEPL